MPIGVERRHHPQCHGQMVEENIMDMYVLFSAGGACYKQKTVENPKFYAPQKWCEAWRAGVGKE